MCALYKSSMDVFDQATAPSYISSYEASLDVNQWKSKREIVVTTSGLIAAPATHHNVPRLRPTPSVFLSGPTPPPPPLLLHQSDALFSGPDRVKCVPQKLWAPAECQFQLSPPPVPGLVTIADRPRMNAPSLTVLSCPSFEYGRPESNSSNSPSSFQSYHHTPNAPTPPYTDSDFDAIPYLDAIIEKTRMEICAEQQYKSCPSPSGTSDFSSVSSSSIVGDVVVSPGNPVTIKWEDGKAYKLIVEAVSLPSPSSSPKRKSSCDQCPHLIKRKRAPAVSLVHMTNEEIAERKKEQNRMAAIRYRQKIREEKSNDAAEKSRLSSRNDYLRDEASRLEKEIADLRRIIFSHLP